MSTRTAKDDFTFHQCRYASSPAFVQGLIANLITKRAAILDDAADRELCWFIHYLSHQVGGLAVAAKDLIDKYSGRIQTSEMIKLAAKPGMVFNTEQVLKIRRWMDDDAKFLFPLKVDFSGDDLLAALDDCHRHENVISAAPDNYPASDFFDHCRTAAASNLETDLMKLCLDPASDWDRAPWYFHDLLNVLRDYQRQWAREKSQGVITSVGRKVHATLDYTVQARILSLLTGETSLGQSFAARQWCEAHPGQARYVEIPPSNDEASFYRAIARAVGLGNFLNYKNVQIRERVEFVLQHGGLCLILNHAENLWPQKNLREAFPGRLAWLFEQVQKGASACMISGPQFFMQHRTCEKTGWNSPEFRKKIDHLDRLPDELSVEEVTAIAGAMLPEAESEIQEAVAVYAVGSKRDLAALEAVAKRAQFLAQRAGRTERTSQDVVSALKFVSGSDTLLRECFNPDRKAGGRQRQNVSNDPASMPFNRVGRPDSCETPVNEETMPTRRAVVPLVPESRNRAGDHASLIEA